MSQMQKQDAMMKIIHSKPITIYQMKDLEVRALLALLQLLWASILVISPVSTLISFDTTPRLRTWGPRRA